MFGFLKRKLGDVVKKFSKEVEDESVEVEDAKEILDSGPEVVDDSKKDESPKEELEKSKDKEDDVAIKSSKLKEADLDEKKKTLVDKGTVGEVIKKAELEDAKLKKSSKEKLEKTKKDDKSIKLEESGFDSSKEVEDEVIEVEDDVQEAPKRRGFFSKITDTFTKIKLSDEKFEELFWDLEVALLENNVALEVIQKIKEDLKRELTEDKISRRGAQDIILDSLRKSIKEVLSIESMDLLKEINSKKPYIIAVIGVNGSGKTTTIAKLCNYLKKHNKSVVLAAADTFRAAAIQQIEHHATALDIKLIKHDYNSDPSAVAFDAIRHAEAKGLDVVVIDTAGRLHSNDNLMNELKKLVRVNKPDLKLFVGESITGNDCVEQAKKYDEIIGIDAIVLSKADVDDKGGAALSISYVTKKPLLFIGTGQRYDDLEVFDKNKVIENLGI